jgi:hypothetical protein
MSTFLFKREIETLFEVISNYQFHVLEFAVPNLDDSIVDETLLIVKQFFGFCTKLYENFLKI